LASGISQIQPWSNQKQPLHLQLQAGGKASLPDLVRINSGVNQYTYVENEPINSKDPRGLWQVTVGGGWGYGGAITFGVNGGQANFGAYFGFGTGISWDYDPNNSGEHACGLDLGVKGSLDLGTFGISSTVNLQGDNSAEISIPVPSVPYMSYNALDPASIGSPTFSFGAGGYVGGGGTYYFR
jgi:hypothetical protein